MQLTHQYTRSDLGRFIPGDPTPGDTVDPLEANQLIHPDPGGVWRNVEVGPVVSNGNLVEVGFDIWVWDGVHGWLPLAQPMAVWSGARGVAGTPGRHDSARRRLPRNEPVWLGGYRIDDAFYGASWYNIGPITAVCFQLRPFACQSGMVYSISVTTDDAVAFM